MIATRRATTTTTASVAAWNCFKSFVVNTSRQRNFALAALTTLLIVILLGWNHPSSSSSSSSSSFVSSSLRTTGKFPHSYSSTSFQDMDDEDKDDMFTEFNNDCYMISKEEYAQEMADLDNVNTDDDWDEDDDEEDDDDDEKSSPSIDPHAGGFISLYDTPGLGKPDWFHLGRCRHTYLSRYPPPQGYDRHMDFYHFRDGTAGTPDFADRDRCFLFCLSQLPREEINVDLLVDAAKMGLPRVTRTLMHKYGLDPTATPTRGTLAYARAGFNAVQEAIRGGFANVVKVLTQGNVDLVIDSLGRTVRDYLHMRGCPIRPKDARIYLGLDTTESQKSIHMKLKPDEYYRGWSSKTTHPTDDRCDIDVVDSMDRETFYNDYFMPGRPFVWRGAVTQAELDTYAKKRWAQTKSLNPKAKFSVATQGEPALTNQEACPVRFSLDKIERGDVCPATGFKVFRSGGPPDYQEAYPLFDGNPFHRDSVYGRNLQKIFGKKMEESEPNHYFFFAGDEAGVTWHWHNAAFNTCFVGMKQWKLAPPLWRGFTALQSKEAAQLVPEDYLVGCTQTPGMMLFLPDFWGHMIVNAGFAVGTAMLSNQPLENLLHEDLMTQQKKNLKQSHA